VPDQLARASFRTRPRAAIALALLGLSVAMTWPLGRLWAPELPAGPDTSFNVWRLAWIAHQLRAEPAALFDANIFHPAALTLAYSDAMLLVGLLAAPWIWLGVHPYAVHNALVVVAFWTASLATYHLCMRFTSLPTAGLAGAIVGGYAPYRFGHTAHLELLWTAFIPLALLALVTLWERPTVWAGCRLGACLVLQTLCSIYYGVFLAIALGIATLLLAIRDRDQLRRRFFSVGVATMITAVVIAPYAAVYAKVRSEVPERTHAEIATYSARPSDYLHVSYEHAWPWPRGREAVEERALYPGAVALGLAVVAPVGRRRDIAVFAALLAVAVDLSLGTNGFLYPWLLMMIPPLSGLRAPARFGAIVITCLAVLSAVGAARVLTGRSMRVAWALLAALLVDYCVVPIETRHAPRLPPPVYTWLAAQPEGVVLELPLPQPDALWGHEVDYQLMSIFHWKPLVNGYSGQAPGDYVRLLEAMRDFPSEQSLAAIRARGVRWLIVHEGLLDIAVRPTFMEQTLRRPELHPIGTSGGPWGSAIILEVARDNTVVGRPNSSVR
jgi:hypothetical protein